MQNPPREELERIVSGTVTISYNGNCHVIGLYPARLLAAVPEDGAGIGEICKLDIGLRVSTGKPQSEEATKKIIGDTMREWVERFCKDGLLMQIGTKYYRNPVADKASYSIIESRRQ
ncbi:hypothetical protein HYX10_01990 [Candidatus Woesearchaeota archaeon]|nr:hypothetical protein [Candidatus Woesearchaeota archaeon]